MWLLNRASAHLPSNASTIAIRPLQDFQAKVEGGGSTVNYGTCM